MSICKIPLDCVTQSNQNFTTSRAHFFRTERDLCIGQISYWYLLPRFITHPTKKRSNTSIHQYLLYIYYLFREAQKYLFKPDQLHKLQKCDEIDNFEKRGKSLLVVVSTPPSGNYENFTEKVREYNTKEPFNFTMPPLFNNYIKVIKILQLSSIHRDSTYDFILNSIWMQFVSIYAAYLYDSVKLYAWALDKLLKQESRPLNDDTIYDVASNGTRIIETIIKNRTYKSKLQNITSILDRSRISRTYSTPNYYRVNLFRPANRLHLSPNRLANSDSSSE